MPAERPGKSRKTIDKAAELERTRTKQRRCRARQKEHVANLEDKLRQYELASDKSCTNPRLNQLIHENELLKRLLNSLGLSDSFLESYRKASYTALAVARVDTNEKGRHQPDSTSSSTFPNVSLGQFEDTPTGGLETQIENLTPSIAINPSMQATCSGLIQPSFLAEAAASWGPSGSFTTPESPLRLLQAGIQAQQHDNSSSDLLLAESFNSILPSGSAKGLSTLCSLALPLIFMNNPRGYSMADLELKLKVGYRDGAAPSEGCRIDNRVLFSVLAEIS